MKDGATAKKEGQAEDGLHEGQAGQLSEDALSNKPDFLFEFTSIVVK